MNQQKTEEWQSSRNGSHSVGVIETRTEDYYPTYRLIFGNPVNGGPKINYYNWQ